MKYQVDFFAPIEATKNIMLFYNPKILLGNQFALFWTFDLFDLLILMTVSIATLYLLKVTNTIKSLKSTHYP